jgi:hypothetical protein
LTINLISSGKKTLVHTWKKIERKKMKFIKPAKRKNSPIQQLQIALIDKILRGVRETSELMKLVWSRKAARSTAVRITKVASLMLKPVDVDSDCKAELKQTRPDIRRDAPMRSSLLSFSRKGRPRSEELLNSLGKKRRIIDTERAAIGRLIQNDHCHPMVSAIAPPRIGPDTVLTPKYILVSC